MVVVEPHQDFWTGRAQGGSRRGLVLRLLLLRQLRRVLLWFRSAEEGKGPVEEPDGPSFWIKVTLTFLFLPLKQTEQQLRRRMMPPFITAATRTLAFLCCRGSVGAVSLRFRRSNSV